MKITWIGHSCFKIESQGYSIVLDPYSDDYVPGYAPVRETANEVLCSHEHSDHNARTVVTMEKPHGDSPFTINSIDCFHDDAKGTKRGMNRIIILSDGDVKIAHFGDLGCELEKNDLKQLENLDFAMIPVGGFYTIDGKQASELVDSIRPRKVIPMHYKSVEKKFGYDVLSDLSDFTNLRDSVRYLNRCSMDTNEKYEEEVLVLEPQNLIC